VSGQPGAEGSGSAGRRAGRVATVAAAVGVVALAVEAGHGGVWLAGLGGVATAAALGRLDGPNPTAARGLASLGLLAGAGGVATATAGPSAGWPVPPLALLSAACWTAVVATAVGRDPTRGGRRLWTVAVTTGFAVVGVGAAAAQVAGSANGRSVAGTWAHGLWTVSAWVVTGPVDGIWLPFVAGLVAAAVLSVLLAVGAIPRHVLLSPRADREAVSRLATCKWVLARAAVVAGVVTLATLAFRVPPVDLGPLRPLGTLLRGLLFLCIVLAALGTVAGFVLEHLWDPSDDPLDAVVPTVGGGVLAAVVATVGTVGASRWTATGLFEGLAGLATVGLAGALVLGVVARLCYHPATDRVTGPVTPAAALVVGAVAVTASPAVLLAPAVAVGAGLVVWDALHVRGELRRELPGVDVGAVERRHVAGTVGVAVVGVTVAVVVRLGAGVVGPALGGEPLVVVVAGTAVLAGVVATYARSERGA